MGIPRVAVITRTKSRPSLLRRALESLLEQDYRDWVWVVVNSGQAPPVETLLGEYGESLRGRVTLIQLEGEPLMGAASNAGIRGSESQFVVLLDDDDTWRGDFLSRTVGRMESKRAARMGGVVTQTMRVEEEAEEGRGEMVEVSCEPMNGDLQSVNLFELASVNQFTVNAFVYERSAYEAVGGYREDLPVLDDWEFNLRFLMEYDVAVIAEGLANYHIRPLVMAGADANSQVASSELHQYYQAAIVNQFIRHDLESGKAGMGLLMGAAAGHRAETDKLERLRRKLRLMSTKIGRVDARTKEMKTRMRSWAGGGDF